MTNCRTTVGRLIEQFLASLRTHSALSTYRWYSHYLNSFRAYASEKHAAELTASFVYGWLGKSYGSSSPSTQHAAARAVVRALNWAVDENIIDRFPLRGFQKPAAEHREIFLTGEQYALCLQKTHGPLRDVVKFLWHSGCRPQELRILESQWLSGRKITLPKKLSKGKQRRRVIYLDNMAHGIMVRLSLQCRVGPVFRNNHGQAWTKNGLSLAFRRLRDRTGIDGLCAYALRHSFITRLLEKGIDVATVAALSGNSPRMVFDVYSHVAANESRLLSQLG